MYAHHSSGFFETKLCMKLQNLRRPARALKAGIAVLPPAKKQKYDECIQPATLSCSDLVEYEQHVSCIKKSFSSHKWSVAGMNELLQETANERKRQIREDCPSV